MNKIAYLGFLSCTSLCISCSQQPAAELAERRQPVLAHGIHPLSDTLKPPFVISMDSLPLPLTVEIPLKAGASCKMKDWDKIKTVKLFPPKQSPAGYWVPMPRYNTEQGLAMSTVGCGIRDHNGALWFGTLGGGVSRYDGKKFTTFSIAQGLPSNSVPAMAEDKSGNIWFASNGNGVSRYDGTTFHTFSTADGLASNTIWSIMQDRAGTIWFGTDGGLSRFDPEGSGNKHFLNLTTSEGLAGSYVNCILEDRNGIFWIGTEGAGISLYDRHAPKGKCFRTINIKTGLAGNRISSILEDKKGNIWVASMDGGLSMYTPPAGKGPGQPEPDSHIHFLNLSQKDGLPSDHVQCIHEDARGNLSFGTQDAGLSFYCDATGPGEKSHFLNIGTAQGLGGNNVLSITEDADANLWIATEGGGISLYQDRSFISFTTQEGLSNSTAWSVCNDQQGNLWFGTYGAGVCRYGKTLKADSIRKKPGFFNPAEETFTNYTVAQGLASNIVISSLADSHGNVWFGTRGGGISMYEPRTAQPGRFTNLSLSQGIHENTFWSIAEDKKGNLWFGTNGHGVCKYAPATLPHSGTRADKDTKRESRFRKGTITTYSTQQGLAGNIVWCITEDHTGKMWFGTNGSGLSCFDGKSFVNFTSRQGLPNNSVLCSWEDAAGKLWVGTNGGGVARYDGKSFLNYTASQGMGDNAVVGIKGDKNGNVFFATSAGITVLKGFRASRDSGNARVNSALTKPSNKLSNSEIANYLPIFEVYNSKTGYPIKDINTNAVCIDSNDVIWAGTGDRVVRFDYSAIHKSLAAPRLQLQSVKINNEKLCWFDLLKHGPELFRQDSLQISASEVEEIGTFDRKLKENERSRMKEQFGDIQFDSISRFYPIPQHLILPYAHNNVVFEFAAVEPGRPGFVKYQYFLEGYDKSWNPVTDKTSAAFGNIREGSYKFRLKAQSADGVWSQTLVYEFSVLPPWYRSWWAYGLYLLAAVGGIFTFSTYRTRALIAERTLLESKVLERTQELREKNEEVETQKMLIEQKQNKILDSINYARRIQEALLKEEEHISTHLPPHFVLFKPKDIVSGDFYWSMEKEGYWYVAAVDCTGHGVPGAFLSMLGMAFLNEISAMPGILSPAEMLDHLRNKIMEELYQTGKQGENKDGMDISLIRIQLGTQEFEWAGAYNSLLIQEGDSITEIKADRQPIGYYPSPGPFTNRVCKIKPGSTVYLFTDGYADQQNKNKGRITRMALKELLLSLRSASMDQQKLELDTFLKAWQGNRSQTDDICMIGIRL
jgi:ligand-binding sensor domain-containing protein/serine phosphatase RsbU (regulator of sigma subunit)